MRHDYTRWNITYIHTYMYVCNVPPCIVMWNITYIHICMYVCNVSNVSTIVHLQQWKAEHEHINM